MLLLMLLALFLAAGRAIDLASNWWSVNNDLVIIHLASTIIACLTVIALLQVIPELIRLSTNQRLSKNLTTSRERLDTAVKAAKIGVWEWDVSKNATQCDKQLLALHGISAQARIDTLEDFLNAVHPDDRARVHDQIQECARLQRLLNIEYRVIWSDGTVCYLVTSAKTTFDENGVELIGIKFDKTEQKSAEKRLALQNRIATLSAYTSMALAANHGTNDGLKTCCDAIREQLNIQTACIWTIDLQETEEYCLRAQAGKDDRHNLSKSESIRKSIVGQVVKFRTSYFTNNVHEEINFADQSWIHANGINAFAGCPITSGDHVIGVLAIFARHSIEKEMIDGMAAIADTVATFSRTEAS